MSYGVNVSRLAPPRRDLRRQNPQGYEARRSPVEQPTKFEFIVNLKTAKEMGLTIPPTVLFRAEKIIK